jgi:hypothetical protein
MRFTATSGTVTCSFIRCVTQEYAALDRVGNVDEGRVDKRALMIIRASRNGLVHQAVLPGYHGGNGRNARLVPANARIDDGRAGLFDLVGQLPERGGKGKGEECFWMALFGRGD